MAKNNSELKSIQKKLMAAIAMVLVASVMVVSSSYAWFTLSTAPEVTGIQTSVGSNGNLEMALRDGDGNVNNITSTSTAGGTFPDANKYWGNLVDLSSSTYHLDQLALAPARLNAILNEGGSTTTQVQKTNEEGVLAWTNDGGATEVYAAEKPATPEGGNEYVAVMETKYAVEAYQLNGGTYLQTPVYGVDGRLSGLTTNGVINGTYVEASNGFGGSGYGIRAVGTSSSMSPEELALRNAQQTVSSAITNSKTSATLSLRDDSVKLANIFVLNILDSAHKFTEDDVTAIQNAIANLEGIIVELDNALDQAVIALAVSQKLTATSVTFTPASGDTAASIAAYGADGSALELSWNGLDAAHTDLIAAYTSLNTIQGDLDAATSSLGNLSGGSYEFSTISTAVTTLLDKADFEINGYTIEEFQSELNIVTQAGIIFGKPTISIVGGVYHDIAEFSGNYSAKTNMPVAAGTYMGVELEEDTNIEVNMATDADQPSTNGYYLSYILNWLASLEITGGTSGASTVITDIYGYAIDLAFRTNASGSSLLLQTDAANRVSSDSGELTQGSGSYMEFTSGNTDFTSGNTDFTIQQVAKLMKSIRVVFVDDAGNILGVAALEVPETIEDTATSVKAPLYMHNYSIKDGIMQLGAKDTSAIITELVQNTPMGVTALVYLDGDTVENADVAISGNSMTGTMNLQFASSAQLDPMDYTFADTTTESSEATTESSEATTESSEATEG